MPFGLNFSFGFKKTKSLTSAERFIQQGKITNAIAEYEKVLKSDCKDLTVLNTVGDLYARLGDNEKAIGHFRTVGDTYASQGFTVKAIAMYKKIAKLKPSIDCVLKLAELYTQQGLHNDARALYLQVAEQALRSSQLEQAIRLFQKMLEVDPDNTTLQVKLAEVNIRLERKEDAARILLKAAQAFAAHGKNEAALEQLKRILELTPNEPDALILMGKLTLEAGNAEQALECLKKHPDVATKPDAQRLLLHAYLQLGRIEEAGPIAHELSKAHQDVNALVQYADALLGSGKWIEALSLYSQNAERLLSSDPGSVVQKLHACVPHITGDVEGLGFLYEICEKAGEANYSKEVAELLAQASVRTGDLRRARDLYLRLVALDPGNPLHEQSYQRIQAQLGEEVSHSDSLAERPTILEELENSAPVLEREHPRKLELAIRRAITDAELYLSYNLPAKAAAPLLAMLEQASSDARLNQKLALVYARGANWADAARCCRTLEKLYAEAKHPEVADRYAGLAEKYAKSAGIELSGPETVAEAAAAVAHAVGEGIPEAVDIPASRVESKTKEIDLSTEWETVEATTAPQPPRSALTQSEIAALIEEIRFYLQHSLWDEAETAINKCAAQVPGSPELAQLREQLAAGRNPVPKAAPVPKQTAPPLRQENALGDLASDLEESLPPTFAIGGPGAVPQTIHAAGMSAGAAVQPALAHPFAESLDVAAAPVRPTDLGIPAGATTQAETSLPLSSQPGLGSELADLFSEFKEDLEEKATASESEDPETHYNLGVAFREMGLLDEAIGELQKVCQAIEHGYKFSHVLQAFTWLAQCFLDKEVPQAAVRWYQKALELPGVDDEARTALHYEIASAFEGAGDKASALKHFMEVYGSNIDYRDVAERIKALKS